MRRNGFIFFALFLLFFFSILYAKPISNFEFKIGPHFYGNTQSVRMEGKFSLNFWVAHVESAFAADAIASNNTIIITPLSSNIIRYVKFNWENLLVEYGASSTHSNLFLTTWDVGSLPFGWKTEFKVNKQENAFWVDVDRGTYDLGCKSAFFSLDCWWYDKSELFTLGMFNNKLFMNAGEFGNSYLIGIGGNLGGFSATLLGFSNPEDIFPNASVQIPSRYVGIFQYASKDFKTLFAMTENEFYLDSFLNFNLFGTKASVWMSAEYIDSVPVFSSVSGGVSFTKRLSKNQKIFLDFSYKNDINLWFGTEWRM